MENHFHVVCFTELKKQTNRTSWIFDPVDFQNRVSCLRPESPGTNQNLRHGNWKCIILMHGPTGGKMNSRAAQGIVNLNVPSLVLSQA